MIGDGVIKDGVMWGMGRSNLRCSAIRLPMILCLCISLCGFLTACTQGDTNGRGEGVGGGDGDNAVAVENPLHMDGAVEKPLHIDGDVVSPETAVPWSGQKNKQDVALDGESFPCVPLLQILSAAEISGEARMIYFMAEDGFASSIAAKDAEACYITYDDEIGWSLVAPSHPISTNVKAMRSIVIVADGSETGLRIEDTRADAADLQGSKGLKNTEQGSSGTVHQLSRGTLITGPCTYRLKAEGSAAVESQGNAYTSTIYTREISFRLVDHIEDYPESPLVLYTASGQFLVDGAGRFIITSNTIDYREDGGERYEDISAVEIR